MRPSMRAGVCVALAGLACIAWAVSRPAPGALRRDIEAILAQPEYQMANPAWLTGLIRRFLQWLSQFLAPRISALSEAWPGLKWAIVVLLSLLLVALVYHILVTIVYAFRERKPAAHPAFSRRALSPDELRAQAQELRRRGSLLEALTLLHEALVRLLDRADLLRHDPSRTNWEYADALEKTPDLHRDMRALALRLDNVWYAGAQPVEGEYEACEGIVDAMWRRVEAMQ